MGSPTKKNTSQCVSTGSPTRALASLSLNSPTRPSSQFSHHRPKESSAPFYGGDSETQLNTSPIKTGTKSAKNTPSRTPGKRSGGAAGTGKDVVSSDSVDPLLASPSRKRKSAQSKQYDRFIPSRSNSTTPAPLTADFSSTSHNSSKNDPESTAELTSSLGVDLGRRILAFSKEPPPASNEQATLLAQYAKSSNKGGAGGGYSGSSNAQHRRRIPTAPVRVLDAPGLADDYYLNLLDWSPDNAVAIALGMNVFIWNAETGTVQELCCVGTDGEPYVTSVRFSDDGSYLAVGTSAGTTQIYDLETQTRMRVLNGHVSRVASLSWSNAILSSGARDGVIWNSDVRVAQHKTSEMKNHRAEVCGLVWRSESMGSMSGGGQGLLASGGNDNVVNVWDGRNPSTPRMTKTNHTAAVKALSWCPWASNALATGGGSSDKTIHLWNVTNNARTQSLVTPSQVTSLVFNPHARELLSTHGFPDHQLTIWGYPNLNKIVEIPQAHETRVLHAVLSPDGCTVATASSDENLKFWKVFETKNGVSNKGGVIGKKNKGETDEIGKRGKTSISIR